MKNDQEFRHLLLDDTEYATLYTGKFARRTPYEVPDPRHLRARIPGLVVTVLVEPGRRVKRGEALLVLEAMKMRNELLSSLSGVVARVHVTPGQMVAKGALLLELE